MKIDSLLKSAAFKNVAKAKVIGIAGGVVLVTIVTAVIIHRSKKKRELRQEEKDAKKYTPLDMNKELSEVGYTRSNLTITEGDAILIANNLLSAMDKWGTDEDAIFASLDQCNTKDDLLLVIQKFGTKGYSGTGLSNSWLTRTGYKNLNGWLRAELNAKETARVKSKFDELGVPF